MNDLWNTRYKSVVISANLSSSQVYCLLKWHKKFTSFFCLSIFISAVLDFFLQGLLIRFLNIRICNLAFARALTPSIGKFYGKWLQHPCAYSVHKLKKSRRNKIWLQCQRPFFIISNFCQGRINWFHTDAIQIISTKLIKWRHITIRFKNLIAYNTATVGSGNAVKSCWLHNIP